MDPEQDLNPLYQYGVVLGMMSRIFYFGTVGNPQLIKKKLQIDLNKCLAKIQNYQTLKIHNLKQFQQKFPSNKEKMYQKKKVPEHAMKLAVMQPTPKLGPNKLIATSSYSQKSEFVGGEIGKLQKHLSESNAKEKQKKIDDEQNQIRKRTLYQNYNHIFIAHLSSDEIQLQTRLGFAMGYLNAEENWLGSPVQKLQDIIKIVEKKHKDFYPKMRNSKEIRKIFYDIMLEFVKLKGNNSINSLDSKYQTILIDYQLNANKQIQKFQLAVFISLLQFYDVKKFRESQSKIKKLFERILYHKNHHLQQIQQYKQQQFALQILQMLLNKGSFQQPLQLCFEGPQNFGQVLNKRMFYSQNPIFCESSLKIYDKLQDFYIHTKVLFFQPFEKLKVRRLVQFGITPTKKETLGIWPFIFQISYFPREQTIIDKWIEGQPQFQKICLIFDAVVKIRRKTETFMKEFDQMLSLIKDDLKEIPAEQVWQVCQILIKNYIMQGFNFDHLRMLIMGKTKRLDKVVREIVCGTDIVKIERQLLFRVMLKKVLLKYKEQQLIERPFVVMNLQKLCLHICGSKNISQIYQLWESKEIISYEISYKYLQKHNFAIEIDQKDQKKFHISQKHHEGMHEKMTFQDVLLRFLHPSQNTQALITSLDAFQCSSPQYKIETEQQKDIINLYCPSEDPQAQYISDAVDCKYEAYKLKDKSKGKTNWKKQIKKDEEKKQKKKDKKEKVEDPQKQQIKDERQKLFKYLENVVNVLAEIIINQESLGYKENKKEDTVSFKMEERSELIVGIGYYLNLGEKTEAHLNKEQIEQIKKYFTDIEEIEKEFNLCKFVDHEMNEYISKLDENAENMLPKIKNKLLLFLGQQQIKPIASYQEKRLIVYQKDGDIYTHQEDITQKEKASMPEMARILYHKFRRQACFIALFDDKNCVCRHQSQYLSFLIQYFGSKGFTGEQYDLTTLRIQYGKYKQEETEVKQRQNTHEVLQLFFESKKNNLNQDFKYITEATRLNIGQNCNQKGVYTQVTPFNFYFQGYLFPQQQINLAEVYTLYSQVIGKLNQNSSGKKQCKEATAQIFESPKKDQKAKPGVKTNKKVIQKVFDKLKFW